MKLWTVITSRRWCMYWVSCAFGLSFFRTDVIQLLPSNLFVLFYWIIIVVLLLSLDHLWLLLPLPLSFCVCAVQLNVPPREQSEPFSSFLSSSMTLDLEMRSGTAPSIPWWPMVLMCWPAGLLSAMCGTCHRWSKRYLCFCLCFRNAHKLFLRGNLHYCCHDASKSLLTV